MRAALCTIVLSSHTILCVCVCVLFVLRHPNHVFFYNMNPFFPLYCFLLAFDSYIYNLICDYCKSAGVNIFKMLCKSFCAKPSFNHIFSACTSCIFKSYLYGKTESDLYVLLYSWVLEPPRVY